MDFSVLAPGDSPDPAQQQREVVHLRIGLADQLGRPSKDKRLERSRPHGHGAEVQHTLCAPVVIGMVAAEVHGRVGLAHALLPVVEPALSRHVDTSEHHFVQHLYIPALLSPYRAYIAFST